MKDKSGLWLALGAVLVGVAYFTMHRPAGPTSAESSAPDGLTDGRNPDGSTDHSVATQPPTPPPPSQPVTPPTKPSTPLTPSLPNTGGETFIPVTSGVGSRYL
jgi:hypothetical protein